MEFADLIKDFGPLVGIVLFFIWRDWRREQDLVDRVTKLEDFNTSVLTNIVQEQASVIATNTEVIKANTAQFRLISETMALCKARQNG
jgi:hypothetical protein